MGEGWPVMGTTLLVGTTFGVVARQSGLEPVEIIAMSLLVFAGASQFAMVQLFSQAAPTPVVIASVLFIVSSMMNPLMKRTRRTPTVWIGSSGLAGCCW